MDSLHMKAFLIFTESFCAMYLVFKFVHYERKYSGFSDTGQRITQHRFSTNKQETYSHMVPTLYANTRNTQLGRFHIPQAEAWRPPTRQRIPKPIIPSVYSGLKVSSVWVSPIRERYDGRDVKMGATVCTTGHVPTTEHWFYSDESLFLSIGFGSPCGYKK